MSESDPGCVTRLGHRLRGRSIANIEAELGSLTALRHKPAGTIRITAGEHAAETVLWPALAKLLPKYPDLKVEVTVFNYAG